MTSRQEAPNHPSLLPAIDPPTPEAGPEPTTKPPLPPTMRVTAWLDPVVDNLGHDPRSHYVERFWLGVIGPSTTWLLRRLAHDLDGSPDGFDLTLVETAGSLGLGMKNGRHSPFMRAIDRACQFGLARRHGDIELSVRRSLPPVTQGQLKRLPDVVRTEHAAWHERQLSSIGEEDRRARRLALTLLELGESTDSAHHQLCTWRVDDHTAERAIHWAHGRHRDALAAVGGGNEAA